MKLILNISYDGSRYYGYQAQKDKPTIQETLTKAFESCLGFQCNVTGSSRTDAGVHAINYCISVEPRNKTSEDWLTVPVGKVHRALRPYLPEDISIIGESIADSDFHPRYSAVSKTYMYLMYDSVSSNPFYNKKAWHLKKKIDDRMLDEMITSSKFLLGTHDFTSFSSADSSVTDHVRTVNQLNISRNGDFINLYINANGFLYNMVRIITGTLVECAYGRIKPEDIPHILEDMDRNKAGRTAPPDGLYLYRIKYDVPINWTLI